MSRVVELVLTPRRVHAPAVDIPASVAAVYASHRVGWDTSTETVTRLLAALHRWEPGR